MAIPDARGMQWHDNPEAAVWNMSAGATSGMGKAIAALTAFKKRFWMKPSGITQKSCGSNTQPN